MKADRCYKLLGFLTIDYKAYETYLEDLALKGYELVEIRPSMVGHFMKIPPTAIQYYVDLVRDKEMESEIEDYIELCKESGWELVGKIGDAKIFKAMKDTEPTPIHTDKEMEAKRMISTLLRREGWFVFFVPLWFMLGVAPLQIMNYKILLDNFFILKPFTYIGIAFLYALRSSYLFYFIYKLKKKVNSKEEMKYSVLAAKVRRNIEYFIMAFFLIGIVLALGGKEVSMWIGVISVMAFILLLAITMEKYRDKMVSNRTKFIYTMGVTVTFLIAAYIGIPMALSGTDKEREDFTIAQEAAEQGIPLSLKDFPTFKDEVIDSLIMNEGSSMAVESYYEYAEFSTQDGRLEVDYYKLRNGKIGDIFWNSLLKEYKAGTDTYGAVEKVATQPHDVDEAYYSDRRTDLLLRKGNEVVHIKAYTLDVWEKENAEVIKRMFK